MSEPSDELACAEEALTVLQNVIHPISRGDVSKQTPCTEFDITGLTEHRRGLDGSVSLGPGDLPARSAVGILSLEFLVYGWDYAVALDCELEVPDAVTGFVFEVAKGIITLERRASVGFDQPVELADNATAFEQLLAFTGRE